MISIAKRLHTQLAPLGYRDIRPFAAGLEFSVFRATSPDGRSVALRFAVERFQSNANDRSVDMRVLLRQEFELGRGLSLAEIPPPLDLILNDGDGGFDVLVTPYIEDDGSVLEPAALGQLMRTLHSLPPPLNPLYALKGMDWRAAVTKRMSERWQELSAALDRALPRLNCAGFEDILADLAGRSLLHMDMRRSNLRCIDGRVSALLDWSNAMIGPPELELARMYESAIFPENEIIFETVIDEYLGPEQGELDLNSPAFLICRFDTALMLALVFNSEAPDPVRGRAAVDNAMALYRSLPCQSEGRL